MKYLIIDKPQRVETKTGIPTAVVRLQEELDKLGYEHDFALNNTVEFYLGNKDPQIFVGGKNILDYTHIIFRGHSLGDSKEYETKAMIVEYLKGHNEQNSDSPILVQNADSILTLPYYNKIYLTLHCLKYDLPVFNTYYRTDGDYRVKQGNIPYPLIIKEYSGENDFREIDGKKKIKKNVYKVDKVDDFDQEFLKDKNFKSYFLQEFTTQAEDYRIFVSKRSAVGGWSRKATSGFMTVNKGEYSFVDLNNEKEVVEIAEKMAGTLNADFMAVDFMFIDGKPYIQEISLHPGFKAYETKIEGGTPVNIAKTIIESF